MKVRTFYDSIKKKCLDLYLPLREVSVDERMVKSMARSHFRQYVRNKLTKWDFKYWILADPTGYTCDFNLYCGRHRTTPLSEHGLSYDVVMELLRSFHFQGYSLFVDNFYTSPAFLHALKEREIGTTGTLRTNSQGIPVSVVQMQKALKRSDVPQGTGTTHTQMMMCMYVGRTTNVCAYCRTLTPATVMEQ